MTISLLTFVSAVVLSPCSSLSMTRGSAAISALCRRFPSPSASFRDFEAFSSEVSAYISTLNETARDDPDFPSPLAYVELQRAGRTDLVEGCMQYGGYLRVSEQLGGVPPVAVPLCPS